MGLNGYPEKLIRKTIKKTLSSNSKSKNNQNLETQNFLYHIKKEYLNNLNVLVMNMV